MYNAPDKYYEDLSALERTISVKMSRGVGIDQTAVDDLEGIEGDYLEMTNTTQAVDSNYIITSGLATFEGPGIPSAVSAAMIAPPITAVNYPPETGIWSDIISDADGTMEWDMEVKLSQAHTSAFSIYTQDVHITKARIRYYLSDTLVRDATIESSSSTFEDTIITTYDRILITVLEVSATYSHLRIAEIEFGASVTLSNEDLGSTLTLIMEYDMLEQSTPLSELQFSLMNVEGEYDPDNPDTLLDSIPLWTPITLAFIQEVEGEQITIPMGTYYITDREASDTALAVTAQDARAILQNTIRSMTLSTTTSIGSMYEALLTDLQIPYVIDDDLYSLYPDNDVTIDDQDTDLLTIVGYIRQYYGVRLDPHRDGYLHATLDDGDEANTIHVDLVLSYPGATSTQIYNWIDVQYGTSGSSSTYSLDLRTDSSEVRSALTISNPLILDETNAERIARELAPLVGLQQYQAEAIADASLEPRDTAPIAGRWSAEDPMPYKLTSLEYTFDGSLVMTVKGFRITSE